MRAERERTEAEAAANARRRRTLLYGAGAACLAVVAVVILIVISQSGGGSSSTTGPTIATSSSGSGGGSEVKYPAPKADPSAPQPVQVEQQLAGIPQNGIELGNPQATTTITEYGDLQCPVCQAFSFQVAPQLIAGPVRDGSVKYAFKNWVIIGPQSVDAAKAALAASEQGKYWNFVELFYREQGQENSGYVTDSFLTSIAKGAGVPDLSKWNRDRRSSRWDSVLSQDDREARGFGFTGTPSIVVEGPGGTQPVGTASLGQIEAAIAAVK